MNEKGLRQSLVELLKGDGAHASPERALRDVAATVRARRPAPELHSPWEDLEHMRIAQEDILRYATDPAWKSPKWPDEYWPAETGEVSDDAWHASVERFFADLDAVIALVRDESIDLTAVIPHGDGKHTYLREVLLVADHNAYHTGQIVAARKLLGDW